MGVGIPGTGMIGLPIAIAAGSLVGKSEYQLEVLKDLTSEALEDAKRYIDEGRISIDLKRGQCDKLYIEVTCSAEGQSETAIIAGSHTNFVSGDASFNDSSAETDDGDIVLDMHMVFDFATTAPLDEIRFIGNHFRRVTFLTLVVGPASCLDRTHHADGACLVEVASDELCGLSPRCHVDEIRLIVLTVLAAEPTVHSNREGSYGYTGGRGFQFGISRQTATQNDLVKVEVCHNFLLKQGQAYASVAVFLTSTGRVIIERMIPSVIPKTRSSSAGNSLLLVKLTRT